MSFARRLKPAHLRLILRIAETGKLQAAATSLAMSQPAASRMLAEIEAQAQAELFERHPKGMILTAVGEAFARHALSILQGFDNLDADVDELKSGRGGKVRIGSVTGPAAGSLITAVRQVKDRNPGIEITIEVAPSVSLVRGLEEGRFDFVIGRLPADADSARFRVFPARNELIALIVRECHPLAGERDVRLQDLVDFEWIIQERGAPIRHAIETMFLTGGLEMPARITNSSSLLVALAMLVDSDAIAPQSKEVANLLTGPEINARLAVIDISQEIFVAPFFMIRMAGRKLPRISEIVFETLLREI